jgi:uncharacterized protein YuzE
MKVEKNTKLDVAYIQLRKGTVKETLEMRPGLLFDLDKAGEVLGIEVLSLKKLAPLLKGIAGKAKKKSPTKPTKRKIKKSAA